MFGDLFSQDIEVAHHAAKRRRIADLAIELRRVAQIRKQDRQCSDANLFARTQRFARKQIAKHLQRCHFGGGGLVIRPGHSFEHQQLFGVSLIFECQREILGDVDRGITPALVRDHDFGGTLAFG